jgi:hypothetical protein
VLAVPAQEVASGGLPNFHCRCGVQLPAVGAASNAVGAEKLASHKCPSPVLMAAQMPMPPFVPLVTGGAHGQIGIEFLLRDMQQLAISRIGYTTTGLTGDR